VFSEKQDLIIIHYLDMFQVSMIEDLIFMDCHLL